MAIWVTQPIEILPARADLETETRKSLDGSQRIFVATIARLTDDPKPTDHLQHRVLTVLTIVGVDLVDVRDIDGDKQYWLNSICWGTSLQQVKPVIGGNRSAENVWNTFVDQWIRVLCLSGAATVRRASVSDVRHYHAKKKRALYD